MTDIEEIEETEEVTTPTLEDDIRAAMAEPKEDQEEAIEEVKPSGKEVEEKPEEESAEVIEKKEVKETIPAPVSLTGSIKQKWHELPEDVKAEWKKREDDIHQMMTRHDGELNLGRKIKEAVTPYMHVIQAEGGTVEGAFKDYLNSAYILRAGTPIQKTQLVQTIARQFGIDLQQAAQPQQPQDPNIAYIQQKIQELEKLANPDTIRTQLQQDMERDNIQREIDAFAADPANKHFDTVKTLMGSLIETGQAVGLQEAYDMACYANPNIRSTLQASHAIEEKRKKEIASKKAAAVSVNGSPDSTSPRAKAPRKSLEDDLREQLLASEGRI